MTTVAPATGSLVAAPLDGSGRIRLAFCIDSMAPSGGTELNAVRTAEQLDPARFALTVFTMRPDGPMRARYAALGVDVVGVPLRSLVGVDTWRAARAFAAQLRARGIDIVHAHDVYSNVFATLAARMAGVPTIITSKRWTFTRRRHTLLNQIAYRASSMVLANSGAVADWLVTRDRVPRGRVVVVHNFVEEAAFPAPGVGGELRRAWGVPADALVLGSVARLRAEKDLGMLLRAAAALRARWPALHVVLVGDGDEREPLRALAAELGIAERVTFAGHQPNRPNPHAAFDVSILCSRHEGFPNTVVEAMAAGRPVVATRVGGVPDAVDEGITGRLVPPGDTAALTDALAELLASPERARAMGPAAGRAARARFHVDTVVGRLTDIYETASRSR